MQLTLLAGSKLGTVRAHLVRHVSVFKRVIPTEWRHVDNYSCFLSCSNCHWLCKWKSFSLCPQHFDFSGAHLCNKETVTTRIYMGNETHALNVVDTWCRLGENVWSRDRVSFTAAGNGDINKKKMDHFIYFCMIDLVILLR